MSSFFRSVLPANVSACCWHSGFVGEQNNTFEFSNLFSLSMARSNAMPVFPTPVGSTTRQFLLRQVFRIFVWYSLGEKFLSMTIFKLYIKKIYNGYEMPREHDNLLAWAFGLVGRSVFFIA